MKQKRCKGALAAALLAGCAWASPAAAVDFEISGFASLVAGRTFGGCAPNALATAFAGSCTRYVADWGHAGVYTEDASIEPESRLGLQGTARFSPEWSATVQVVARLATEPLAQLEWAYVSWSPSPAWTFQLGRKRLPLFYYSDFQDVGYAYPWVRVPPDVYGWDVVNYNGASASYRTTLGGWSLRTSGFVGTENSRKNDYSRLIYDQAKDVRWPRIAGADLEFSRDWFTGRIVYMRASYEQIDRDTGIPDAQPSGATSGRHAAYGGSVNIDWHDWLARSEYSVFDRSQYGYEAKSWFVSLGRRFGRLTPMVTYSRYDETTPFPANWAVSNWSTRSVSLRYELGDSSALKLQFDRFREPAAAPFVGSSKLLSVSYDVVF